MKIKNKGIENANAEAMSAKRLLLGSALALLPFAPHASAAADETILVTADAQNSVTAPVKDRRQRERRRHQDRRLSA